MQEHERDLIERMSRVVLASDTAQAFLIEACWNVWTAEEREAVARKVRESLEAEVGKVVKSRLTPWVRTNVIAGLIERSFKERLSRPDVVERVNETIEAQLVDLLSRQPERVREELLKMEDRNLGTILKRFMQKE